MVCGFLLCAKPPVCAPVLSVARLYVLNTSTRFTAAPYLVVHETDELSWYRGSGGVGSCRAGSRKGVISSYRHFESGDTVPRCPCPRTNE